jgi:hypothetical protein
MNNTHVFQSFEETEKVCRILSDSRRFNKATILKVDDLIRHIHPCPPAHLLNVFGCSLQLQLPLLPFTQIGKFVVHFKNHFNFGGTRESVIVLSLP